MTRPTGWSGPKGVLLHRSSIPEDERAVVDGIPVTSLPRTILDLAAVVSTRQVERALNEMEVRGLTDRLSVSDLLERYPGRRGSAVLRRLLGDRDTFAGVTQNELEELFLALVDSHGLPRPRVNADISVRGRFFRPDFLWAQRRLIVELDGRGVHGTAAAFEADRERDRILLTEGWRVMRVTWRQLRDRPDVLCTDLRRALRGVAGSTL